MALITHDIFGNTYDKVKRAIKALQSFCPQEGYYVAYSGGKDSTALLALVRMSGVKHDVHYNATTVDPPELVRFIIGQFDTVIYENKGVPYKYFTTHHPGCLLFPIKQEEARGNIIYFNIPPIPTLKLIPYKKFPPTRLQRYCCEALKETNGVGRIATTGVRWDESKNRKDNQGLVTIFFDQNAMKTAEEMGANFTKTVRGGLFSTLTMLRNAARLNFATAQTKRSSIRLLTGQMKMCGSLFTQRTSHTVAFTMKDVVGSAA